MTLNAVTATTSAIIDLNQFRNHLQGAAGNLEAYFLRMSTGTNFRIQLGDASGANDFRIEDAGNVRVGGIDSDGNADFAGTLTLTGDAFLAAGLVVGHTAQITEPLTSEMQILGTGQSDSSVFIGRWGDNPSPAGLHFIKSRDPVIFDGTYAIVSNNDLIGAIEWLPDDGVDLSTTAARYFAEVDDASPAPDDIGMAHVWEQMPGGGGGGLAETMRLAAGGDLSLSRGSVLVNVTGKTVEAVNQTNTGVHSLLGGAGNVSVADNETFTFTTQDGCLLMVIDDDNGFAGLFFIAFSSVVAVVSDPGSDFDGTDVDNAKIAVFKSTSNNTVSIKNYTNATRALRILVVGPVDSATAPS